GTFLALVFCQRLPVDGFDFRRLSLIQVSSAAVVAVPPELRHARLRLEVLWIREPLAYPFFRQFPGYGREVRAHFANVLVTGELVTAKAAVDSNHVAAGVQLGRLGYFRTRVW